MLTWKTPRRKRRLNWTSRTSASSALFPRRVPHTRRARAGPLASVSTRRWSAKVRLPPACLFPSLPPYSLPSRASRATREPSGACRIGGGGPKSMMLPVSLSAEAASLVIRQSPREDTLLARVRSRRMRRGPPPDARGFARRRIPLPPAPFSIPGHAHPSPPPPWRQSLDRAEVVCIARVMNPRVRTRAFDTSQSSFVCSYNARGAGERT